MNSKQYFVELVSAYINNRAPVFPGNFNIDWDEIMYFTKIHSVQVPVFMSVDKLEEKPPVYNELKSQFLIAVNISAKQEYWMEKVINELTDNDIDHILFKGYVLRNYYPNKEARSFGDIDFLIKEEDREKNDKVLKKLGFEYDEDEYCKEVWTYHKDVLSLEVHTDIIYEKLFSDFDYIGYFREKLKNKVQTAENTYELKAEDHFIYLMVHLAKHFYNYGVGIRMIMDIAVMKKYFGNNLDYEYIDKELKDIGLGKFADTIFCLCNKYLGSHFEGVCAVNNIEVIMNYVIMHGVFGFDNKGEYVFKFEEGKKKNILNNVLRELFPSYEMMTKYYKWFTGCPKYMLFYGWIRRILEFVFNRKKNINKRIAGIHGDNSQIDTHKNILRIVGLR